jgi:hypothetical protein
MDARKRICLRLFGGAMASVLTLMLLPASVGAASVLGTGGGVAPMDPGWTQDPSYLQAKLQHRLMLLANGQVQISNLSQVQPMVVYPSSINLYTGVTGTFVEPKGDSKTDDAGVWYNDHNFWWMCGPGATSVALWYFSQSRALSDTAGTFTEPRYWGPADLGYGTWYFNSTAYFNRTSGHGQIVMLADVERPTGVSWPYAGMLTWNIQPGTGSFGTPLDRVRDTLNWETGGHQGLNGWYVLVTAASITSSAQLQNYAHIDMQAGTAFVVAANTYLSNGEHLPSWSHSINHYVAVVGYNDAANPPTYTIMDTCGPNCSDRSPYGIATVPQTWLYDMVKAVGSGGGVVW